MAKKLKSETGMFWNFVHFLAVSWQKSPEATMDRQLRSVKCSHFGIFSVVNRPYFVSQTIPYNVEVYDSSRNTTRDAFMNNYIHVRELIFRLSRDVSLGRLCSNVLIASATTTSRNLTPAPRVVRLYVNAFYFSTTARRVTSPSWGPPPPCKQAHGKYGYSVN